jgi:hypothetical protein
VPQNLLEESFDCGVDSTERAVGELQVYLGDEDGSSLGLKEVALEVLDAVGLELDHFTGFCDLAVRLDFIILRATVGAREGHDYEFLEVGNRHLTH